MREFAGRRNWPGLDDRQALTDLEGIDIYDRTRLQSEGVTDIHALAHSDLVELMLRTRIPISQLVDWTDQAILYLHLVNPEQTAAENDQAGSENAVARYALHR